MEKELLSDLKEENARLKTALTKLVRHVDSLDPHRGTWSDLMIECRAALGIQHPVTND